MKEIVKELRECKTFLVLTHVRPDGDAVASSMAIYYLLLSLGKEPEDIEVFIPHISKDLAFIDDKGIAKSMCTIKEHDAIIIVDCCEDVRIEGAEMLKEVPLSKKIYVFDHHESTETPVTATRKVIDPTASSCTCVLYRQLMHYIEGSYRGAFLRCIATGILSDTSGMQMNVTPECKNILANCEKGHVDINLLHEKLQNVDERTQVLTMLAIDRYTNENGENVGVTYITQEDLLPDERDLKTVNHKAIIKELMENFSCEVLILLMENQEHEVKGSLRTLLKNIDLNEICAVLVRDGYFVKGGGHAYSAGFLMKASNGFEKARQYVFSLLRDVIYKEA